MDDWKTDHKLKEKEAYIRTARPLLVRGALFCDGTEHYVIPNEVDPGMTVRFRFRTARENVDAVILVTQDARIPMRVVEQTDFFDYYEAEHKMGKEILFYYFEITSGMMTFFYNCFGLSTEVIQDYAFRLAPGFHVPKWAEGAVMYQIMTDRFRRGNVDNDVADREYYYIDDYCRHVSDWYQYPEESKDFAHFYGGDLPGVIQKLDYLSDLGVEVIYFNPIFVSPSSHKYDTQDYDFIDPHLAVIKEDGGSVLSDGDHDNRHASKYQQRVISRKNLEAANECFIELVSEAHKRGIRVILDGVFNHCGSFNKWLDHECIYETNDTYEKGAYISADSPYRDFFDFRDKSKWPYNDTYDGWWGYNTLPKLNYEGSQKLCSYILNIGRKWVSPPYNADGWRLDVAADLGHSIEFNHMFWKDFRKAVKEANPEALILAENYGNSSEWLAGDEWDTVMNYDAFMEPLTWFLTGMEKHSDEYREDLYGNACFLENSMRHYMSAFLTPSLFCAMNELSNHDHSRFLTRTNKKAGRASKLGPKAAEEDVNVRVFMEAVVIQMTWPGAPTIYYGDEAGLCGFTDPDNRRTYPWGRENQLLIDFHREMIRIHKENPALKYGSLKLLKSDYQIFAYGRFQKDSKLVIAVNNRNETAELNLPVWQLEVTDEETLEQIMCTANGTFTTEPSSFDIDKGMVQIMLDPQTAIVLRVC